MLNERNEILSNFLYNKNSLTADLLAMSDYDVEPYKIKQLAHKSARLDAFYRYVFEPSGNRSCNALLRKEESANWVAQVVDEISKDGAALLYFNTGSFALSGDVSRLKALIVNSTLFFNQFLTYDLGDYLPISIVDVQKNKVLIKHVVCRESLPEETFLALQHYFLTGTLPPEIKGDRWSLGAACEFRFLNKDFFLLGCLRNLASQLGAKVEMRKVDDKDGNSSLHIQISCQIESNAYPSRDNKDSLYIYMKRNFVDEAVYWLNLETSDKFVAIKEWGDFCNIAEQSFISKIDSTVYVDCLPYITPEGDKLHTYGDDLNLIYSSTRTFKRNLIFLNGEPISNSLLIIPGHEKFIKRSISGIEEGSCDDVDKTPRVLIVEDSKIHRDNIKFALEGFATVVAVNSAEKALEVLSSDLSFDLILLDQGLPGMQGQEFMDNRCRELRCIPVILNTAHALDFNVGIQKQDYVMCLEKNTTNVSNEVRKFLANLRC